MSIVLTIIGVVLLLDLLWWLTGDRLLARTGWGARARLLHGALLLVQFSALLLVLVMRGSSVQVEFPRVLTVAVYVWHLLVVPVLAPLLIVGLVLAGGIWLVKRVRSLRPTGTTQAERANTASRLQRNRETHAITRRGFVAAAAVFAPQVFSFGITGFSMWQLEQFRVRRLTLSIKDLPPALDGVTIAHVTDTHVGRFSTGDVLHRITTAVNELGADLVLLTGDLINGALNEIPEAVEMLRRFEPRAGIYMVEGNHDLFQGRQEFAEGVAASGVPLLVNKTAEIMLRGHPVNLLGLRWGTGGFGARPRSTDEAIRASLEELIASRNPEAFPILLAHHPHAFEAATDAGLPLTLAGHTHGGQLMLNEQLGAGPILFRYWSGIYRRGESQLVVSNGVGNWFPLRTAAPAEVMHLTLRRT